MHAATPSLQEVDVVRQGAGFVVNMVLRLKRGYVVLVEPDWDPPKIAARARKLARGGRRHRGAAR
jgi:hypothetical protein